MLSFCCHSCLCYKCFYVHTWTVLTPGSVLEFKHELIDDFFCHISDKNIFLDFFFLINPPWPKTLSQNAKVWTKPQMWRIVKPVFDVATYCVNGSLVEWVATYATVSSGSFVVRVTWHIFVYRLARVCLKSVQYCFLCRWHGCVGFREFRNSKSEAIVDCSLVWRRVGMGSISQPSSIVMNSD